MKWSFKMVRIAGIDVYLHATFVLLVAWVAISYWLNQGSLASVVNGVLFLLGMFACVVLHEFGHALAARRFGIQTRDITLLPIGGVARLEKMPEKPVQELWVALAGPGVNLVLGLALFVGLSLTGGLKPADQLSLTAGGLAQRLMMVNLSLLLFNLVPAFPMDGGRAVRALLALRLEYTRATQIAANLGQGIAFLFGLIGLFNNPVLLFIAFFVWIGAAQESSMVQMKSALGGIPVNRAMLTEFHTLAPTDSLGRAVQLIISSSQHDFPVAVNDKVVGILIRDDLIRALIDHNESMFVSFVMRKEFLKVDSAQMLAGVAQQFEAVQQTIIPVENNGTLVGLLTLENIGEFLLIQRARASRHIGPPVSV
jgi:Zn-dependent protease/CBS domain-containing protein